MSAQKYHVTKSGKVEPCLATSRQCPLVQFSVEASGGNIKVTSLPNKEAASEPTPKGGAKPKKGVMPLASDDEKLRFPPSDSTLNESVGFRFRESVAGYDASGVPILSKEVSAIHLPTFLARIHGSNNDEVPRSLLSYAESKGFGDPSNYEVVTEPGYYGDENYYAVHKDGVKYGKFVEDLRDRFWGTENRVDMDRILPYVRSKGVVTAGLAPFEALKKQLTDENPGRTNAHVEAATNVVSRRLRLENVSVPNPRHYASVRARAPKTNVAESSEIVGVVARTGTDTYVLVDGYHRLKYAKQLGQDQSGQFLILS